MTIRGLQKTTLLDFPNKVACTVFLGGCNFRCPFCYNVSLVYDADKGGGISAEDFFTFLKKRKGLLDGVCVTGGEPALAEDLDIFLRRIKDDGFLVKLDTNGSFPGKLAALIEGGLVDYVAMDIKNSIESYKKTIGAESFGGSKSLKKESDIGANQENTESRNNISNPNEKTMESRDNISELNKKEAGLDANQENTESRNNISNPNEKTTESRDNVSELNKKETLLGAVQKSAAILMENKIDFEFRTTVVKELHTESDMESIGKWLSGGEKYYLQRFKSENETIVKGLTSPSDAEMQRFRGILAAHIPNVKIR
jgi:anaerobic ribonucleoside-triphosphate reductase activating protein